MEYLKIDNKLSSEFGVYVYNSNLFDSASEDVESVEVPGRNGILHISNNRFNSFNAKLDCYITDLSNWSSFKNYLLSLKDTIKLAESYFSDVYRVARLTSSLGLSTFNPNKATFTLTFNCRPEIYLNSGDDEQDITSGQILTNPTAYESKPIIIVSGSGSLTINDTTITIATTQSSMTIDSERMDCYNGSINCNNDVTLDEFPTLKSGDNMITYTGFTNVKIKGKWWRL